MFLHTLSIWGWLVQFCRSTLFVQTLGPWLRNEKQKKLSTFQFLWCLWLRTAFIIRLQQLSLGHLCTLALTLASVHSLWSSFWFFNFLDSPHIPIAYASFPTTFSCVWRNKHFVLACDFFIMGNKGSQLFFLLFFSPHYGLTGAKRYG